MLLVSHLDTVGFERDRWTVDPLEGAVRGGYIYGRGAVDNKGLAAVQMTVLLELKRRGRRLERDVILAVVADEESGGERGIRWLLKEHPKKLRAEFALNEGGVVTVEDGAVRLIGVQSDCYVEVLDCSLVLLQNVVGETPEVISRRKFGTDANGCVRFRNCLLQTSCLLMRHRRN